MAYEPKLPAGVSLPPGHSIDANSSRYKELHSLAEREKWSQAAFSDLLGIEARRVSAEHERTRAAPAPAPAAKPAVPANWDKLTTQQQLHHALASSPGRK
jgi:hypothetical protein